MTSLWPGNCDANTWQVISDSLDIDFIHGDIHGRSRKNTEYLIGMLHDKQHIILSVHCYIQEIIRIDQMEELYDNCLCAWQGLKLKQLNM